jgi:hypothetical protein
MLIDFRKPILDFNGDPIKGPDGKEVTLVSVCHRALESRFQDEPNLSDAEITNRYVLGLKIANPLPVDITIKEAAQLMKLCAKLFGPLVIGRVNEMFEPPTATEALKVVGE